MIVTKAFLMKAIIASASAWEMEPNFTDTPCIVEALWHETRGQSFRENLFVATVAKKRREVKRWPNTFCTVINEKGQFSYTGDGKSDRIFINNPIERIAFYKVVEAAVLISYGIVVETEAYHYYNKADANPDWAKYGREEKLEGLDLVHTAVVLPKRYW